MFRNRLKGGHRVGAPNNLTQHIPSQHSATPSVGGWGMPQQQYGTPPQPGQPQQPVQQQQPPNAQGWDNSWNWEATENYSNNGSQGMNVHQHQFNPQQQHQQPQLNQLQQPLLNQQQHALNQQHPQQNLPQFNPQPQAYSSQQLPPTSQQPLSKPTQNATYSNQHPVTSSSGAYPTSQPPLPTNAEQQFINGNKQNGEWNNDWGNDNWGNDWAQSEAYNNNNKPANYAKQEQQQQHYQHQQQNEYQHFQAQHQAYQDQCVQQQHQAYQDQKQPAYQEQNVQEQQAYQEQNIQQHTPYEEQVQQQQGQGEHQNYYQQQHYGVESSNAQHPTQDPQQYSLQEQHHQQNARQLEQQQLQHLPHQHPQPVEEEWSWDGDELDTTKKKAEAESASNYQLSQAQSQTSSINAHSQEVTVKNQDGLGIPAIENDSQQTANKDVAGDGWPDWENDDAQALDQQQQKSVGPAVQCAVNEGIPVTQQGGEGSPHAQQHNYHSDDGLEPAVILSENNGTDVAPSVSKQNVVAQEPTEVATQEEKTKQVNQESWNWNAHESQAMPESVDSDVDCNTAPSVESTVQPEAGYSEHAHYHMQDQMSYGDVRTSTTPEAIAENSVPAVQNHEGQTANPTLAPADNWDDDGWGDGWEAEAPLSQEKPTLESSQEQGLGAEEQHQEYSSHLANFSSSHQFSEIGISMGAPSSLQNQPVPETTADNSTQSQQPVGEPNYHLADTGSNAQQFSYGHQYQQDGSTSVGWDDGLGLAVNNNLASKDEPADNLINSVTQGVDAMSLTQEQKEDLGTIESSGDGQPDQESKETVHSVEETGQVPSYQQHTDQMHVGMYHELHPLCPSNQHMPDLWTASQHNFHVPSQEVEHQTVQEQHQPFYEPQNLDSQRSLHRTNSPDALSLLHPQPSESPLEHNRIQNSRPEAEPSAQPPLSEAIHRETLPDHVHQYSSYQSNQYQGLNQEVVEEPYSLVPDPMVSRIPDGASSVTEIPASIPVAKVCGNLMSEEPQGDSRHSFSEVTDRPSSTQSAQSVSSQPSFLPSQPLRPPSAHTVPERPLSNQSAHSVRSSHSVQSAYSNRSTQSSHSLLSQNQEVPPNEETRNSVSHNASPLAVHQEQNADTLAHGSLYVGNKFASSTVAPIQELPADGGVDPTAAPANNPVGPPPTSGPIGTVTSLKARKGSPFQPPSGKRPSLPQSQTPPNVTHVPQSTSSHKPSVSNPSFSDVSANLEMLPDNNEQPINTDNNTVPLWTSSENLTSNVKLAVAAPSVDTMQPSSAVGSSTTDSSSLLTSGPSNIVPSVTNNPIPLVIPGMMKEEQPEMEPLVTSHNSWVPPDPPPAHNTHPQPVVVMPKVQSLSSAAANPSSPGVLDLSRPSRVMNEPRGDGSRDKTETPNFSRMVPGESCKGERASLSTYQAPAVVPSMPSERVVTGNDDPQPVLPVRIKQEPSEVRSPPDGPYTSDLSGQGASVIPPIRSETIGSEEPASRNFPSSNSGSRPDLSSDHRDHRGDRGNRWDRDHSRDRDSRSGDRFRDRSGEYGRDYYRDDSPHSRRSYDRDYDFKYDSDRRGWRHDSEDEDSDRRYESRDRRDRAYKDELDRYSDRPIKEEKDRSHRESSKDKRHEYRDRSRDYRSYDDDPYYGRSDRSQPVSRSSSINNLDNEGDRSGHSHRSRHDYYDRHDRRDSRSRDSDHRDRDGPYSRNQRDRDSSFSRDGRDGREPRRDTRYYGQRGYEDAYNSRELYDQYQYYYQYYRDHPYYKEYYRQWMKQYGHAYPSHESFYDDRTSIHSGRSSVNDELKKSISSGELSGVPSVGGDSVSEAPQRLTPVQYGRPHINARFTPGGGLLFVLPKDPRDGEKAVVQIRDVQKMLCMDPALSRCVKQMKSYPGPLTLADTHKDVVVRYCEQQAAEAAKNQALLDGESIVLIWEYLALLVKQNGKLLGSDVAGLLLKGQDKTSQPQHKHSASSASTEDVSEASSTEGSPQNEGNDLPSQSMPVPPSRDEALLLKKFTQYLCLGRKKEAVDYAMREGLWGHALALSFKMDSTTHMRVLAAFSNSIPRNDVLITLFQQLSGKRPEVTKNYAPQQWGSWRHHLAMMVSNPTGQSQRDKASIVSLGETLAARGQLHAAHFCYLVAEADWGCYSNKESKLVLIGSSHHLPFQAFATNEAIQCTEIYEFARSLDTTNPVLETFQSYKLIYALRLAEFGFPSEALRYCEVIGQIVRKSPSLYQGDFLSQVYELASRLKYHDLHYQMHEGEIAEMPDPQWLSELRTVVDAVKHQEAEQLAAQEYQSYNQGYPAASSYQNSSATQDLYPQATRPSAPENYSATDASFQQGQSTPDPYQSHVSTGDVMDGAYHQHTPLYPATSQTSPEGVATPSDVRQTSESGSPGKENGSMPMMMQPQGQEDQSQYAGYGNHYWPGYSPQDPNASSGYMHQPDTAEASHSSLPASPEASSEHLPNTSSSVSQPNSLSSYQTYPQPYQPWDQQQQPQGSNSAPDQPQSMSPVSSEASQRSPEEEAYWAEMTGKKTSNDAADPSSKEKEKTEDEKKYKNEKDLDGSLDKNSGWSIGSLFGWKKSKQAVLPDDKNPTIVWNEEKKRWENKDGGEEVSAPPPPPPKMSAGGPGAPPMYLSRGGPRKSRYVNTERDSSQQPSNGPSAMLPPPLPGVPPMPGGAPPIMPGGPPMPSNFMVPGPIPQSSERESSSPQQPQIAQNPTEQQTAPLSQAPLTSIPDSSLMRRSRYISESSIELEEDWPPANNEGISNDGGEGAVPMMAPPGQPQFFNPNQFNPTTSPPNPAQTRRVGPGKRLYQGKR